MPFALVPRAGWAGLTVSLWGGSCDPPTEVWELVCALATVPLRRRCHVKQEARAPLVSTPVPWLGTFRFLVALSSSDPNSVPLCLTT